MKVQYDRLQIACETCSYPTSLIRTQAFSQALQSYHERLRENEKRLFDSRSKYHAIHLLEAHDGDSGELQYDSSRLKLTQRTQGLMLRVATLSKILRSIFNKPEKIQISDTCMWIVT
jgi:hypothetical protein